MTKRRVVVPYFKGQRGFDRPTNIVKVYDIDIIL